LHKIKDASSNLSVDLVLKGGSNVLDTNLTTLFFIEVGIDKSGMVKSESIAESSQDLGELHSVQESSLVDVHELDDLTHFQLFLDNRLRHFFEYVHYKLVVGGAFSRLREGFVHLGLVRESKSIRDVGKSIDKLHL
jgi:hypothetical protein